MNARTVLALLLIMGTAACGAAEDDVTHNTEALDAAQRAAPKIRFTNGTPEDAAIHVFLVSPVRAKYSSKDPPHVNGRSFDEVAPGSTVTVDIPVDLLPKGVLRARLGAAVLGASGNQYTFTVGPKQTIKNAQGSFDQWDVRATKTIDVPAEERVGRVRLKVLDAIVDVTPAPKP
jgi:hypothetical protein